MNRSRSKGETEQDRYALTYRATEARQVMDWIAAGQSGCLIGPRGVGKSNFLRYLLREDVRQHYLGRDYADFTFVLIDLLALAEHTDWAAYELMLNRLLRQLRLLGMEKQVVEEVASLHHDVARSRDPLTAQRAIERCVDSLCHWSAQRIVLLFDEFDAVFRTFDPPLFRCLRSLRDAHKDQVSYIIAVADELARLRDDLTGVEHFYRLVNRNTCGLGPYGEADARQMIHYLASWRCVKPSAGDTTRLIEITGGHAGLLKASLSLLWSARQGGGLAELAPVLKDEPMVQAECWKVWDGLSESEQAALCALAGGAQTDPHALDRLKRKDLVREGQSELLLFSSLFDSFVRQQAPPLTKGTVISRSPPVAQIDGRRVEGLTELEFEMLCYLYEHRGQACTKDELIENVYRQQYNRMKGGVTDGALQTLVSRLRGKIEPDQGQPRYIITIRGEGYKFVEPIEG